MLFQEMLTADKVYSTPREEEAVEVTAPNTAVLKKTKRTIADDPQQSGTVCSRLSLCQPSGIDASRIELFSR